jgi:EAL domain-containing protein (putative c-di-GMP-specific phosphodiesterase class I)
VAPPDTGLILPGQFISQAEETGLIVPMGEWALRSLPADEGLAGGLPGTPPLGISVNLSSKQLLPGFADRVRETSSKRGSNLLLRLEITEHDHRRSRLGGGPLRGAPEHEGPRSHRRFRDGVLLHELPSASSIDGLKIDRSFINAMSPSGEGWRSSG